MEKNIRKKLSNVFEYLKERCVPIGALKRVSWKDLAAIVGKSKSTISDYKLGKINIKVQDTEDIFGAYGYLSLIHIWLLPEWLLLQLLHGQSVCVYGFYAPLIYLCFPLISADSLTAQVLNFSFPCIDSFHGCFPPGAS